MGLPAVSLGTALVVHFDTLAMGDEFAAPAHLGSARVAEVRVMRPDHDLRPSRLPLICRSRYFASASSVSAMRRSRRFHTSRFFEQSARRRTRRRAPAGASARARSITRAASLVWRLACDFFE